MPKKTAPKKRRAIRLILEFVQLLAVCLTVGGFLGAIVSAYAWIIVKTQTEFLFMTFALVGVFFVGIFINTECEKRIRIIEPSYSFAEISYFANIKAVSLAFALLGLTLGLLYAITSYFGLFPANISSSLRLEILKTIVQANGFLIGFSGVVYAQLFWAINHQQSTLQVEIIKSHVAGASTPSTSDVRERFVVILDKKRSSMAKAMFLVIGTLIVSIALSLSAMATTGLYSEIATPTSEITLPLALMIIGIVILALSIATSKMSLSEELERP
jgi:hypothetical protein